MPDTIQRFRVHWGAPPRRVRDFEDQHSAVSHALEANGIVSVLEYQVRSSRPLSEAEMRRSREHLKPARIIVS